MPLTSFLSSLVKKLEHQDSSQSSQYRPRHHFLALVHPRLHTRLCNQHSHQERNPTHQRSLVATGCDKRECSPSRKGKSSMPRREAAGECPTPPQSRLQDDDRQDHQYERNECQVGGRPSYRGDDRSSRFRYFLSEDQVSNHHRISSSNKNCSRRHILGHPGPGIIGG